MTAGEAPDEARLRDWLTERVAAATGLAREQVRPDLPVHDLGVGSRELAAIAGDLGRLLGRSLPAATLWQHPTIDTLAAELAGGGSPEPAAHRRRQAEPVAVVGLGCRLPGADSPSRLWRLLAEGTDAVGSVPEGRWGSDAAAGLPGWGAFLPEVAGFDAAFFGISPREAAAMDPQQRILLEVTWEALEHAGIPPSSLRGSRTGVFAGISSGEYGYLTMTDVEAIDAWHGPGAAAGIVANRVSYHLDLRGPSVVLDTACSSSLVAVHHAVRSLGDAETDVALACGVNLMLTPGITAYYHRAGVLAADGRCKAFDAAADGIVRGEGCGVVVLKRLADARRDGDRVLAVITGTATNSDGGSNGLTAPNPAAQRALLTEAYAGADLDPSTVDYVEAHGTGTLMGDPIEAHALGAVLGVGRDPSRPLLLGSVKTNLGHLEGAAGIAGLVKTVLALHHGRIPPSLHFHAPNPHIPFERHGLRVVDRVTEWPRYAGVARAGVSAFGFGGTNAHVVLEEWAAAPARAGRRWGGREHVFALSGHDEHALRARAAELAGWLDTPDGRATEPRGLAAALATRRDHLRSGAVVVASGRRQLASGLRTLTEGGTAPNVLTATRRAEATGPVFVFSGYGSQWPAMGSRLLTAEPEFRAAVETLEPIFLSRAGFSLRRQLRNPRVVTDLAVSQPTLFGMQLALAAFWRAHGVRPAAVLGHSMGEVAAAVVAGALDVEDALWIMMTRSKLLAEVSSSGAGAMAVVELSPAELRELDKRFPGVSVAVYASPVRCTVSGSPDQVGALVTYVESLGRSARRLDVAGAGHSPAVDAVLAEFRAGIGTLDAREPELACYSSVLDDPRAIAPFDVDYWAANLRRPVRFTHALAAAMADGHRTFLEISPHPIALTAVQETAAASGAAGVQALPSVSRRAGKKEELVRTLGALHVAGHPAALRHRYPDAPVLDLPGQPWRHQPYWADRPAARPGGHPLLGTHVELPADGGRLWQAELSVDALPWLADHHLGGVPVLPAMAYAELALAAARQALRPGPGRDVLVRELDLRQLLTLDRPALVQTTLQPDGTLRVRARSGAGEWRLHATARVGVLDVGSPPGGLGPAGTAPLDLYPALAAAGHDYGPAFRGLRSVRAGDRHATARVELPEPARDNPRFVLHPVLGDSCLHALAAAAAAELAGTRAVYLPESVGTVRLFGDARAGVRCDARIEAAGDPELLTGAVRLVDADGLAVAEIDAVRLRRMRPSAVPRPLAEKAFEHRWLSAPVPEAAPREPRTWLLLPDDSPVGLRQSVVVAAGLAARGDRGYALPQDDTDELPSVLDELDGSDMPLAGVVLFAGAVAEYRLPELAQYLLLAVAGVVRRLAERPGTPPRLWLVTSRGTAVLDGEPGEPGVAFLRGLVRVLAFEHPELRATLVDLDGLAGAEALAGELRAGLADDEVAWRAGRRFVARTERVLLSGGGEAPVVREGAFVITGGLGRLGLLAARWLADRGASRIVLCGRGGPSAAARAVLDEIRAGGTRTEVVRGDIAGEDVAEELVRVATADGMPLRGVLHAAGVVEDRATIELTAAELARVWRPKVLGGWRLHEATAGIELDWWLAFSSAAALFGSPGQAAYATANAWLDALVRWRRANGLPAATVNWGAWHLGDGAADNPLLEQMSAGEGLEALAAVLADGRAATGIARLDVTEVLGMYPELADRPFFATLAAERDARAADPVGSVPGLDTLAGLPPEEAAAVVGERIRATVAGFLGCAPGEVDPGVPLTQLGLDSLMAVRARGAIERDLGTAVPVPLLLRGASLADVTTHLVAELGLGEAAPEAVPELPALPSVSPPLPVAPREPAERWVAGIWRQVLGDREIGVYDDFFAAGGTPAQAGRIRELVAERLGGDDLAPGTAELFTEPTIAAMADLLRAGWEGGQAGPMRTLCATGERPPLFLFHPAGSSTSVYRPLVELLGGRQPCYAFDRLDTVDTVRAKASRYVELIRTVRAEGPYLLGGWSFGGMLAYEAARQLTEAGAGVALVVLIDTILPLPAAEEPGELVVTRLGRFLRHVQDTYGVRLDLPAERLASLSEREQVELVLDRLTAAVPGMGPAVLEHQRASYVDARVAERYRPEPYAGRVLLYRAGEPHPLTTALDPRYLRTDDDLGWAQVCADLSTVTVPGDHLSMIDPPHVAEIAAHLDTVLAEVANPPREVSTG